MNWRKQLKGVKKTAFSIITTPGRFLSLKQILFMISINKYLVLRLIDLDPHRIDLVPHLIDLVSHPVGLVSHPIDFVQNPIDIAPNPSIVFAIEEPIPAFLGDGLDPTKSPNVQKNISSDFGRRF